MVTGPPRVAPKLLKRSCRSLIRCPDSSIEVKGLRALVASLRKNSYRFPWKALVPDLSTTLKTPPPVRLYSAPNPLVMPWNSCTASGVGLITTFSEKLDRLRLPSRYQPLAPPCPPLTETLEPRALDGSGKVPNWLLNPKLLPGGPATLLTPGIRKTNCWRSRLWSGISWIDLVSMVVLKLAAPDSTSGASAFTSTVWRVASTRICVSRRVVLPAGTSISVMSRVENPAKENRARYLPGTR